MYGTNKFEDFDTIYNYLIDYGVVSEDALDLVLDINGRDVTVLYDVIYARSGYHDFEQYLEYEDRETYKEIKAEVDYIEFMEDEEGDEEE